MLIASHAHVCKRWPSSDMPNRLTGRCMALRPVLSKHRSAVLCSSSRGAATADTPSSAPTPGTRGRHDLNAPPCATTWRNWPVGGEVVIVEAKLPVFQKDKKTCSSTIKVLYQQHDVPSQLATKIIKDTKKAAFDKLYPELQQYINDLATKADVNNGKFVHPGGTVSAAELALMKFLADKGTQPQKTAKESLISGSYEYFDPANPDKCVVKTGKGYPEKNPSWFVPLDCPESLSEYGGPYPIKHVNMDWGGVSSLEQKPLPQTIPACKANSSGTPSQTLNKIMAAAVKQKDDKKHLSLIQHIAFVELDSNMAYKQAIAYHSTGKACHADNALAIIKEWAETNGHKDGCWEGHNGPLEGAWGIAAMARALELLRKRPNYTDIKGKFEGWVRSRITPKMADHVTCTCKKADAGVPNQLNNWHSSIVEAEMAMAILTDDKTRFDNAVGLFHKTVEDYVWKWGRQKGYNEVNGRCMGECTETYRDGCHPQFGLGGLIQAAEMAWQQDQDLYCSNEYALATAMEFKARVIRAGLAKDMSMLPPGFELQDLTKQPWKSFDDKLGKWDYDTAEQKWKYTLDTDKKYLRDISFLPCGWEIGYNHYAGRLGLPMTETAELLKLRWPEWHVSCLCANHDGCTTV
eukprot:GHUV01051527.1.p1 GENE.GHUV01051527.1~~GHUV01051527.1.p1  ORF type:complete len:634 (+),score=132.79 GHUV01051527.1:302-2203(+)